MPRSYSPKSSARMRTMFGGDFSCSHEAYQTHTLIHTLIHTTASAFIVLEVRTEWLVYVLYIQSHVNVLSIVGQYTWFVTEITAPVSATQSSVSQTLTWGHASVPQEYHSSAGKFASRYNTFRSVTAYSDQQMKVTKDFVSPVSSVQETLFCRERIDSRTPQIIRQLLRGPSRFMVPKGL